LVGDRAGAAGKQAILDAFRGVLAAQGLRMDVEFLAWTEDGSITPDQGPDRSLLPT
jgi:hypothetical protein